MTQSIFLVGANVDVVERDASMWGPSPCDSKLCNALTVQQCSNTMKNRRPDFTHSSQYFHTNLLFLLGSWELGLRRLSSKHLDSVVTARTAQLSKSVMPEQPKVCNQPRMGPYPCSVFFRA